MFNNHDLPYIVLFTILFLGLMMVVITVFIYKSRSKFFEKEIEHQKKIHTTILEAQEFERKRIAQDLHDDVSSKLIALSLNLHLLKSNKTKENDRGEIIETIEQINKSTIETSRKIAHTLFPPLLEKFGLSEAIEEIVNDYNKSKQVQINYSNTIDLSTLKKNVQLHVFRITQELISNSIKHGKASEITIDFFEIDQQNTCSYYDNGIGINQSKFNANKGIGFINVENRIRAINGSYSIDFSLTKDFRLKYVF